MNIQKLKQIRRVLKEKFKPEQVEYIRLDNNKMIVIEPGCNGDAVKFEYVMGLTQNLILKDFSIDDIRKEYPGFEPKEITEEMNEHANEFRERISL